MTYVRKTEDEWQLLVNYGSGFEEVTASKSFKEIRDDAKDYRLNCPEYPRKIRFRRVKIKE